MSRTAEAAKASLQPAPAERISPAEKIALGVEVLGAYRQARRALSRADLPTALRELRGGADIDDGDFSASSHLTGKQLGGAVSKTLSVIPMRSKCLMQSLTLTAMLTRRGIDSSLVIGVNSGEKFGAHAWVEYHGRPLLPVFRRRFERLTEV
jgi:transglutaminase superfamily protein